MRLITAVLFVLATFTSAVAQLKHRLKTITTKQALFATTDRAGDLYIVTREGIQKFDDKGTILCTYSQPNITSFDTGNGVRMLAYKRGTQQYDILSPSLQKVESRTLDPSFAIDPELICSSGDYNIWILDRADWSLKKIDLKESVVLVDVKMDTSQATMKIPFMREYQNLLFLLDVQTGILIYNSLGNYIKTIPLKGVGYFNFLGEELYYFKDGKINLIDLFTGEQRVLPFSKGETSFVVMTDMRLFSVLPSGIQIYEFSPTTDIPAKD